MKHTKNSKSMYLLEINIIIVVDVNLPKALIALEAKAITICPALMLATNRTVKVKGRIKILIDSITTNKGIKMNGEPAGTR